MSESGFPRSVIIAVDGGEHSENALKYYMNNLHQKTSHLMLVHVMEPIIPMSQSGYVGGEVWTQMANREHEKVAEIKKKFSDYLEDKDVQWKFSQFVSNHPGEILCDQAKEKSATMIVMGTRGMGKIRRTILGSVSDYVLHHAHCPICICRPH